MTYTWNIHLFAGLSQRFQASIITFTLPKPSMYVYEFKQVLISHYPEHEAIITSSYVAANHSFKKDEHIISSEEELGLLPPVSGGQQKNYQKIHTYPSIGSKFFITNEPIIVEEVMNRVITPACGATLLFVGTTREFTEGVRTISLQYEAYEPMAIKMMAQIGDEVKQRWQGADIAISHRIGEVDLAEISVVIAVATARRDDCYAASRYAIERLKQIVPIWKKEMWEDGSEWKGHQLGPWDPTAPPIE